MTKDADDPKNMTDAADPWDEFFGTGTSSSPFDLIPIVDDIDEEVTKKTCLHLKKKKIKFQTFEFWFCPECKKEITEDGEEKS